MLDLALGIPLYNSERTIDATLRSVASQSVRPSEIHIIDDHSTDQSIDTARRLATAYGLTNVTLASNPKNLGIAGTYNKIASRSNSTWTQILDADDVLADGYYSSLQTYLSSPDVLAVITAMTVNIPGLSLLAMLASKILPYRPPLFLPLLGTVATRSGVIYRTSTLKTEPFPDPQFDGSDIIHLLKLRLMGECVYLPSTSVRYRVHANAASAQASTDQFRCALAEFPKLRPFFLFDMWCRKSVFGIFRSAAREVC